MGKLTNAALVAVSLALSGCSTIESGWIHELTPADIEITKATVSAHLLDPRSAHWSHMIAVRDNAYGDVTVCGMVNSKAINGGYPGMRPYRVLLQGGSSQLVSLAPAIRLWDNAAHHRSCKPHVTHERRFVK